MVCLASVVTRFCLIGSFQSQTEAKPSKSGEPPVKKRKLEFLEEKFTQDSDQSSEGEDSDSEPDDPIAIDYRTLEAFLRKQVPLQQSTSLNSSSSSNSKEAKKF